MILNDGELDGVTTPRTEKPRNCIRDEPRSPRLVSTGKSTGTGFGLGFSVITDVADTSSLGSVGTCSWGGMASTTFWIDPVEELIGILMTQVVNVDCPFHAQFRSA